MTSPDTALPPTIGAAAPRALTAAGYTELTQLAGVPAAELGKRHGLGPDPGRPAGQRDRVDGDRARLTMAAPVRMTMRGTAVRVLAAIAIVVSGAAGCTRSVSIGTQPGRTSSSAQTGPASSSARPGPASSLPRPAGLLGMGPCSGTAGFRCGTLRVPLDPSGAVSGQLSLRVAVSDVAALSALMARVHAADAATAGELSQGLHASALCADMPMPWGGPGTPVAARAAVLNQAVARLTTAQVWPFDRATAAGNGFIQTCLNWPAETVPAASAAARLALPRIPVLLLAGTHDLSTPLPGARAEAALASDGHLIVVPRAGHSVQFRAAGNPAQAQVARFLAA